MILQKKIDGIKAENDTDIDIEEGSICIKTDDVGVLSSVSKKETGPEVSSFLFDARFPHCASVVMIDISSMMYISCDIDHS